MDHSEQQCIKYSSFSFWALSTMSYLPMASALFSSCSAGPFAFVALRLVCGGWLRITMRAFNAAGFLGVVRSILECPADRSAKIGSYLDISGRRLSKLRNSRPRIKLSFAHTDNRSIKLQLEATQTHFHVLFVAEHCCPVDSAADVVWHHISVAF